MKKISVIVPTHNRHEKLKETIAGLREQNFSSGDYEILIVDDGSTPPVRLPEDFASSSPPETSVIRTEGVERSIARNTGAENARGELLVFVDNDIAVERDFLAAHWNAYREFPDALIVGAVILPPAMLVEPFVRFRQRLEKNAVPSERGLVDADNFCTAQNMAIRRDIFERLGGFEAAIVSGEDQDFALRYTARGGKIAFLPEALVVHCDNALDIRSYCRRSEWGSRLLLPFYLRYPNLPANIERERVNGAIRWKGESISQVSRKIAKSIVASPPVIQLLFLVADVLERISPQSFALDRTYRLLLGAHIFRGYRAAMQRAKGSLSASEAL